MNPNEKQIINDRELEKAAYDFADDFVRQGNYPDKASNIDVSLYSLPGRDIL